MGKKSKEGGGSLDPKRDEARYQRLLQSSKLQGENQEVKFV